MIFHALCLANNFRILNIPYLQPLQVFFNMTTNVIDNSDLSIQSRVNKLESSINALLDLCKKLSTENETFKASNSQLMHERSELQLTNDKVRVQVEAMVERLKALDEAS